MARKHRVACGGCGQDRIHSTNGPCRHQSRRQLVICLGGQLSLRNQPRACQFEVHESTGNEILSLFSQYCRGRATSRCFDVGLWIPSQARTVYHSRLEPVQWVVAGPWPVGVSKRPPTAPGQVCDAITGSVSDTCGNPTGPRQTFQVMRAVLVANAGAKMLPYWAHVSMASRRGRGSPAQFAVVVQILKSRVWLLGERDLDLDQDQKYSPRCR